MAAADDRWAPPTPSELAQAAAEGTQLRRAVEARMAAPTPANDVVVVLGQIHHQLHQGNVDLAHVLVHRALRLAGESAHDG